MEILFVRRVGLNLVPDGADCASVVAKLPFGRPIRVDLKQPRNPLRHRLYWALCHRIGDAVGVDSENISDLLKIETGHCVIVKSKKYGELRLPRSISFAKVSETEFKTFLDRCIQVIHENWGISRPDILEAIKDLLDEKQAA